MFWVSNHCHGKEATGFYKQRWGIEQVFSHFRKRGFGLETTHMTDGAKIKKLLAVLTLKLLACYGWGFQMEHDAPLKFGQNRKSIIRIGLDRIAQMFSDRVNFEDEIYALA